MLVFSPSMLCFPGKPWFSESIPFLPRELERLIFEFAAREDKHVACTLTLVARRTQIWIEPILYRNVMLTSSFDEAFDTASQFLDTIYARPASFFARHVKSLFIKACLSSPQVDVEEILSVCTGLESFGYSSPFRAPELVPYLNDLPSLTRLAIPFHVLHEAGETLEWSLPLFRSITHLEMPHLQARSLPPPGFLPKLEYLLVNDLAQPSTAQTLLSQRSSLKALAFVNDEYGFDERTLSKMTESLNQDPRFVVVKNASWTRETWGHDQLKAERAWAAIEEKVGFQRKKS